MKILRHNAHSTEVIDCTGRAVFFSYTTPVLLYFPELGAVRTKEFHSRTTQAQIRACLRRWNCDRVDEATQEYMDAYVSQLEFRSGQICPEE